MTKINSVEFNENEVELPLVLMGMGSSVATLIILSSKENSEIGFVYDDGKLSERAALILAYVKKNPSVLEMIKKEFNLHELGE